MHAQRRPDPEDAASANAPRGGSGGSRRPMWLEALLDQTERSKSWVANSVLLVTIIVSSLVSSLVIAAVVPPLVGWPRVDGTTRIVVVTSLLVPLIVGVPAVLFGDALVRRVQRMRAELRDALAEARLASRAKSDFLANMSHEIRTPLNGVLGMAQVLEGTALDPMQRSYLRTIRDSGDLLIAIIDDVLDLSKIEAGRIDLHPVAAPLGETLAGTVRLFEAKALEQGTRLSFAMAPGSPAAVIYDTVRVRQALANLVSNAVKFTRNGRVDVYGSADPRPDGGWLVRFEVRDTGIGIPPEAQARLFQDFMQAESGTARTYGGTGLGLAISRRLARVMGGDITLQSQPGQGSVFTLCFVAAALPGSGSGAGDGDGDGDGAWDARDTLSGRELTLGEGDRGGGTGGNGTTARPAGPGSPDGTALSGLRVLVVDDSRVNRAVARGLLAPLGVTSAEAEDGETALAILAEEAIDLVLLDMQMPGMDGPATLRALRAAAHPRAAIPVIAMTAEAMPGDRARCLAMGMQGYVGKPVRLTVLLAELARVLATRPGPLADAATAGPARPPSSPAPYPEAPPSPGPGEAVLSPPGD